MTREYSKATGLTLEEKLSAFDGDRPLSRARTIPSSWYFDPEIYALERRRVFGGSWLLACRSDQVAAPGSFATIDIAGEPILVVRDEEGVLRAFHNVCRHRAAQVINAPEGKATKLRCRYHGWTYDLAGRLRGVPEFDGVEEFCREEQGLPQLAVAENRPFVFVHQGTPSMPFADFLAPFVERTRHLGLDRLHFAARKEYDLGCNWKVFVDNFQDGGYHVNTVHPGLASAIDYSKYHTENLGLTCLQSAPMVASGDAQVGKTRTGQANYWWLFPNLMVNLYSGVMDTNLVLPLGPDRCRVIFDFYFPTVEGEEAQRYIADSLAVAHQVQLEDMGICEEVQRGLKSVSYDTGRFSVKRETGGYYFHQLLARHLRG